MRPSVGAPTASETSRELVEVGLADEDGAFRDELFIYRSNDIELQMPSVPAHDGCKAESSDDAVDSRVHGRRQLRSMAISFPADMVAQKTSL